MRIAKAESWILRFPFIRTTRDSSDAEIELPGVTLYSDDERGTGFTFTADGGGSAVKALLDDLLLPRLVDRDLDDVRAIWHEFWSVTHRLGRGINKMAIAATDTALWDLRARVHGHSLARELGQTRDRVPAYGSGKASPLLPVDELVSLSQSYVQQGLQAVKLRVGMDPAQDITRVAEVRKAVGPDIRLMCDANERLDLVTALWLGRRLAEFDVFWFEEPIESDDLPAYRRLRQALPMPIALGEHLFGSREFARYIDAGAADVVQPNAGMVGGITEMLRVGELARAHGVSMAPHFMSELHVHVAAALPGVTYLEYFPFLEGMLTQPLVIDGDGVRVPEGPGHGITFHDWVWDTYRVA